MSRSPFANIAIAAVLMSSAIVASAPAHAEQVGGYVAAGVAGGLIGVVIGSDLLSRHDDRRIVDGPTRWYGVPGYQRPRVLYAGDGVPVAGPGRHVVCDWQDRYDRLERYIGSRRICWVEAR